MYFEAFQHADIFLIAFPMKCYAVGKILLPTKVKMRMFL